MQTATESLNTPQREAASIFKIKISKWPFILGDALLVLLSIFLAFYEGGSLTSAKFACCILGVALGSVLAIMPFVLEHLINSKVDSLFYYFESSDSRNQQIITQIEQERAHQDTRYATLKQEAESLREQLKASSQPAPEVIAVDEIKAEEKQQDPEPEIALAAQEIAAPVVEEKLIEAPLPNTETVETSIAEEEDTMPLLDFSLPEGMEEEELLEEKPKPTAKKKSPSKTNTPLLAKAIAQASNNKPSKTVQRLMENMSPKAASEDATAEQA